MGENDKNTDTKTGTHKSQYATDEGITMEVLAKLLEKQSDYRIRMSEPSPYDGTRDALMIDGWVKSVERFSNFHDWDDTKTCRFAVTLLRGRADVWYRTLEAGDDLPTSWLILKRLLIDFFKPDNSTRMARDKLVSLKQTNDLVSYINQFMDIKLALPKMNEEEATDRFVRGLSSRRMRAFIRQNGDDSLQEVIRSALAFDSADRDSYLEYQPMRRQPKYIDDPMDIDVLDEYDDEIYAMNSNFRNRRNPNERRYNNNYQQRPNNNYNNDRPTNNYNNDRRFNNSNNYNNFTRNNNRNNNGNNSNSHANITCYYCDKKGHIKSLCPVRRADIKALDNNRQRQSRHKDFQ